MSRTKADKQIPTKESVLESFRKLSLNEQVEVFREEKEILDTKAKEKADELDLLQSLNGK